MIVRLSGGLGNQLFQYAFGRAIAMKRGKRLYLDTFSFSRDPIREYALDGFHIEAKKIDCVRQCFYNAIYYANRKLHFITRGEEKLGLFYESANFGYDEISITAKYFEGCWQNVKYFREIKEQLRMELRNEIPLTKEKKELIEYISKKNMVAVHVRHGDYLFNKNQEIYTIPTENYYFKAMEYIKEKQPDCEFVFFSDDIEWCKKKFYDRNDCNFFTVIEDNTAHEDLFFMSYCKHYIIANSSFSWWGSWLGSENNSLKVAPLRWFYNSEENARVIEALLEDFYLMENE